MAWYQDEREIKELQRKKEVMEIPESKLHDYVKKYWNIDLIPEEGDFQEKFFRNETEYFKATWFAVQNAEGAIEWIKRKGKGWGSSSDMSKETLEMECRISKLNKKEEDYSAYFYKWIMIQIESIIKNGWVRHLALIEQNH